MIERLNSDAVGRAREFAAAAAAELKTLDVLLARLDAMNDASLDAVSQLQRFFLAMTALALDPHQNILARADTERLSALAANLLRLIGIKPKSSRFSYLYAELELCRARSALVRGYPREALVGAQNARALASRGTPPGIQAEAALMAASCCLALGQIALASEGLALPVLADLPERDLVELWRLRLAVARWRSKADFEAESSTCEAVLRTLPPALQENLALLLKWERLAFDASYGGNPEALVRAAARGGQLSDFRCTLTAYIWSITHRLPNPPKGFTNVESIRRHYGLNLRIDTDSTRLMTIAKTLEELYDADIPLNLRASALDSALGGLARVTDPDVLALTLGGTARWLRDSQQNLGAAVVLGDYQNLCKKLSQGRTDDLFGLGLDMRAKAWDRFATDDSEPAASRERTHIAVLRTAPIKRAADLTRVGLATLPKLLKLQFSLLFADKKEARDLRRVMGDEITAYLVRKIGELKGPIVKIAQMTSVIHAALPDSLYQAIITLREDAPGLAPAVARAIVRQELGDDAFERLFATWSDEPVAAASIGQVHRATTFDGRTLAVKIQYPGIEEAIRADIRILRTVVLPVYRILFPAVDVGAIADTVEREVLRECDYHAEAETQARLHVRLGGTIGVKAPLAHADLSTRRLLAMEFIEGRRFSEYVGAAPQEERDRVGALIARSMLTSCFAGEDFSSDPHPGNYLFQDDGTVVLIDFGATSRMDPERVASFKGLALAAAANDLEAFKVGMTRLGYVRDQTTFDFASELSNARAIMRPLLSASSFRFGKTYFSEVFAYYGLASPNRKNIRFAAEDVALWRFLIGLQVLLCELEAEANWGLIFWEAMGTAAPAAAIA